MTNDDEKDREKMLPLVSNYSPELIASAMRLKPGYAKGYLKGMAAQRDADWERVKLLPCNRN